MDEASEAVLQAARVGAGWAFERLYTWLAPGVHGYLRAQGLRDAEDVTSEVFLAVFQGVAGFEGDSAAFRSWVFTIAHHRLVDARRRAQRRPDPVSLDAAPEQTGGDTEGEALAALGHAELLAAVGALTDDQRDVLLLRIVADQSLEQVAAALGKPVGAVKSLQHRGLETLRRRISSEGVSK